MSAVICNSSLHPLSTVEDLYIEYLYIVHFRERDDIEDLDTLWLAFLLPFTAVKNLYLSKKFVLSIAVALKELVEGRICHRAWGH